MAEGGRGRPEHEGKVDLPDPSRTGSSLDSRRAIREWLLARIGEAASLPPPHLFSRPQEFWDEGRLLARVGGLTEAAECLCRLSQPLDGSGKRDPFPVRAYPRLFCGERIWAERIVRSFLGRAGEEPIAGSYRFPNGWQNRLVLGDSLLVLESLLFREGREGEVQAIYFDPPYGVNFPSHFAPFAEQRSEEAENQFERVKVYRDSWGFGLSSYLTYLRERLVLCRKLLNPTGSLFLQIGEENLHHVRILLDEVFGERNFIRLISFRKTSTLPGKLLRGVSDYILWYAKDKERVKYRPLYLRKQPGTEGATNYRWVELDEGRCRKLSAAEQVNPRLLPPGARVFALGDLRSAGESARGSFAFSFRGRTFRPYANSHWKTTQEGMERLAKMGRLVVSGRTLMYKRYLSDFPMVALTNHWPDVRPSFRRNRRYVVQTVERVVERCLLMTTDPGDLVLDPTCGGGTTALVSERWGRRWICIDAARVPIALTRTRLITAIFPHYLLRDPEQGPAGGFLYARRQNSKGEEVGGIMPHLTLEAIAKDRPAEEEVLVDRPEEMVGTVRLSGPFSVESLLPVAAEEKASFEEDRSFEERMREVLRLSPVFETIGRRRIGLQKIRMVDKPFLLGAEAEVAGRRVGIAFGSEKEPIGEAFIQRAVREAGKAGYGDLYLVGFGMDAAALDLVGKRLRAGVRLIYVQASLDLLMGFLLKVTRSSQIFSLCGIPELRLRKTLVGASESWRVELVGTALFDPEKGAFDLRKVEELSAWFLDTDYDGRCFNPSEAFFSQTASWAAVEGALGREADKRGSKHPGGARSAPFQPGRHRRIAVKTIDQRGTELLVVRSLPETGSGVEEG
ncbi:MAG: site-specific DNA-methyltransferase [Candidatus Methylacidiphilaceae bacterium]